MTWADPDARLAELRAAAPVVGFAQLPALTSDELLHLRWAVQFGLATAVENELGERMVAILASLDTAVAEAWQSSLR